MEAKNTPLKPTELFNHLVSCWAFIYGPTPNVIYLCMMEGSKDLVLIASIQNCAVFPFLFFSCTTLTAEHSGKNLHLQQPFFLRDCQNKMLPASKEVEKKCQSQVNKSTQLDTEGAMKSFFFAAIYYFYFSMRKHLVDLCEGQAEKLDSVSHTSMHTLVGNVPNLSLTRGSLEKLRAQE